MNATAKTCERHVKSLWTLRQTFVNATAKVCERYGESLWTPRQKFVNTTAKGFENWKKPRRKLALERKWQHSRQSWPNWDPGNKVWSRYGDSEAVAISDDFNKAFTYDEILALLDKYHDAPFFPHGSFGIQFSKQGFNSRIKLCLLLWLGFFKTMKLLLSDRRDLSVRCREITLVLNRVQSADFRWWHFCS